jgi:hypothetical protein
MQHAVVMVRVIGGASRHEAAGEERDEVCEAAEHAEQKAIAASPFLVISCMVAAPSNTATSMFNRTPTAIAVTAPSITELHDTKGWL